MERELSYSPTVDKYQIFLTTIFDSALDEDTDFSRFKVFAKALLLQRLSDEPRFNKLLDEAIEHERQRFLEALDSERVEGTDVTTPISPPRFPRGERPPYDPTPPRTIVEKEPDMESQKVMYYQPGVPALSEMTQDDEPIPLTQFLQTDDYFSISRRQMVKAWQTIKLKERAGFSDNIDIKATVERLAAEGLFNEPVYQPGLKNRENNIVLYVDCRGGMAPFHELSNRLIETCFEGGHVKTPIYYFQNYPRGVVYRNENLTGPVKLKESLLKANRNFTLAIVISDAGLATNDSDSPVRLELTNHFLDVVRESCAHIIWLNPMPRHRWKNTGAEDLLSRVYLMAPLIETGGYDFQETIRTIFKNHQPV
ncbi:MAG TPA: hypothetical protein VGD40_02670 [Chryseosolibacter sp.]